MSNSSDKEAHRSKAGIISDFTRQQSSRAPEKDQRTSLHGSARTERPAGRHLFEYSATFGAGKQVAAIRAALRHRRMPARLCRDY